MRKFLVLALVLVGLVGCGNDDGTTPGTKPFSVNLVVTDPGGAPVSGLEAKLHVFFPPQFLPGFTKAAVMIPFSLPVTSEVTLIVYDMDGGVVRTLVEGVQPAGYHTVVLATDDDGNSLIGTHLYRCELVASVENVEQYRSETYLTLYTSLDVDQQPVMGITDAGGRINYRKKTEFPYLYNPGLQTSYDENAQVQGTYEFPDKVEIRLMDPLSGQRETYTVIIGQGSNTVDLVWVEGKPRDGAEVGGATVAGVTERQALPTNEPPDAKYSLGPAYPNPFN